MRARNLMWAAVYLVCGALMVAGVTLVAAQVTATVKLPVLSVVGLVAWGVFSTFLAFVPRKSKKEAGR